MAAQSGRDMLVKVDSTGTGSYQTVAGLRARRISLDAGLVEVTDADSPGRWRELIEGAGVRRARVTGAGVFKDAAADATVRGIFFNGTLRSWQLILPSFAQIDGPFQLTGLDYAGTHDGEVTFELTLESAGQLTVTAI